MLAKEITNDYLIDLKGTIVVTNKRIEEMNNNDISPFSSAYLKYTNKYFELIKMLFDIEKGIKEGSIKII